MLMNRRYLLSSVIAASALGATGVAGAQPGGFTAASSAPPGNEPRKPMVPGMQAIWAVTEVTGGGQKVYAVAAEYARQ